MKNIDFISISANSDFIKRCESVAQFLTLFSSFVDLVLMISDQSEEGSFKLGSELYSKCSKLASELLTTLSATGNAGPSLIIHQLVIHLQCKELPLGLPTQDC